MYDRRDRYVADAITTASPQHLLCLLYDRLALDIQRAGVALDAGDKVTARDMARHAQDIVFELRSTLDMDVWDGAASLASVYGWLITQLGRVVVHGDAEAAASCSRVVEPLRLAWKEAAAGGAERPEAVGVGALA
jgi:flagellar protein FliS